jgi:hypothetical protein
LEFSVLFISSATLMKNVLTVLSTVVNLYLDKFRIGLFCLFTVVRAM